MAGSGRKEPEWARGREARRRSELRKRFCLSLFGHVALVLGLAFAPRPSRPELPDVVTVDLLASIPAPSPAAAAPAKAAAKKAPAPPPPQAKPAPPPPPPSPTKVLPKEAPQAIPKKPKPKPKPKAKPKPVQPRKPAKELDYDDALAQLRGELGETEEVPVEDLLKSASAPGPRASAGTRRDPKLAAWQTAVTRHLRKRWITPPEFLNRNLRTDLSVTLTSDGTVIDVSVARSSGDAFADDNAVRAVQKSSPLPRPPKPGENTFSFVPEIRP